MDDPLFVRSLKRPLWLTQCEPGGFELHSVNEETASERKALRSAALLVAVFTIVIGIAGLISPDSVTTVRRLYFATPVELFAAGAVRIAMGVVVILCASASRAPKTLRVLGAVMCMQALAATLLGPGRARAVLEWETMQGTALLRVGAAVALVTGGFIAFALSGHRPYRTAKRRGPLPRHR